VAANLVVYSCLVVVSIESSAMHACIMLKWKADPHAKLPRDVTHSTTSFYVLRLLTMNAVPTCSTQQCDSGVDAICHLLLVHFQCPTFGQFVFMTHNCVVLLSSVLLTNLRVRLLNTVLLVLGARNNTDNAKGPHARSFETSSRSPSI
jgi:hypothetical protein